MNVIVSNLNSAKFANLDVDVIKYITGEFTVDEIVQSFSNFFFNRMFLDITSIEGYRDINTIKKLSIGLDVSKIILLLSDDAVVNSNSYISRLISMGIYNFAKNENELKYLYDNPNSYKDVAHLQEIGEVPLVEKETISTNVKIIGVKNFTAHAGATSLIYMLKKQLSVDYYTVAIEINKKDFMFFNDKDMVSCKASEFSNVISKYSDANVILVDLNDLDLTISNSICTDILYLMESSILMINKLILLDNQAFTKLIGEKVILNRSLLDTKDIRQLEFEVNFKFFDILPPLNDRVDNSKILFPLLSKLNLYKKVS